MIPFAELKPQYLAIQNEIDAAIKRVFDQGWFILGKECDLFEQAFADYLGVKSVAGCASGTDATTLALRALGIKPDDEVITAPNTCVPTICGIVNAGAKPTFSEVSSTTLTLDPRLLEKSISPKTRAIVAVHLYGHPCDMDPILHVARAHNLLVIEDCAQAHGTLYKGKRCGSFGDAAAFSFYPSKNLGAYGDGGAVATNNLHVADQVKVIRNYGEKSRYHSVVEGMNSRLDELQAAILSAKLPHLDRWNADRRARADRYNDLLTGIPLQLPREQDWAQSNWHLYVVRTEYRDRLRTFLDQRGIGTQIHYPTPAHLQPAYKHLGYGTGSFPIAEYACNNILSLPLYPELSMDDVETVAKAIRDFFS